MDPGLGALLVGPVGRDIATSQGDDVALKVAHVIAGIGVRHGGPAITLVQSAQALQRRGVESTIFTVDLAAPASAKARRTLNSADLPAGAGELDIRVFETRFPRRL